MLLFPEGKKLLLFNGSMMVPGLSMEAGVSEVEFSEVEFKEDGAAGVKFVGKRLGV